MIQALCSSLKREFKLVVGHGCFGGISFRRNFNGSLSDLGDI